MKCSNCGANISELDEICPKCKVNLDEYEEKQQELNEEEATERKSDFLSTINRIVLVITIIGGLIQLVLEMYITLVATIVSCIAIFIFTKIFKTIIDLLQSIDEKLTK